jgi:D-inositol-3-phosphate glycosyltransferase
VLGRRELLAVGARRHAARFSWDRTVDALVDAYTAAIAERAARLPVRTRRGALRPVVTGPAGAQVAR